MTRRKVFWTVGIVIALAAIVLLALILFNSTASVVGH